MVEDNPDHAYISKLYLEKEANFSVVIVQTFEECRLKLKDQKFDIILLDYNLPSEDGLTILKYLKKDKTVDVPIVVVTGHGHEEIAVAAMKAGAFDYVIKNQDYPAILPSVVKSVIEKYRIHKEKQRMEREILIRNKELRVLNAISEVVNQSLVLEEVLNGAIERVTQLLEFDAGAIYLSADPSGELSIKVHKGFLSDSIHALRRINPTTVEFVARVFSEGLPLLINELAECGPKISGALFNNKIKAIICAPLRHKNTILGVLIVASKKSGFFTARHLKLLNAISNQISIAIENAKLYEQTEKLKTNLENVLDSSLDLIITLKKDGTLQYFNERFTEIYGYSLNEIGGKNFLDFVPDQHKKSILDKISKAKTGKTSIYETEMRKADGSLMSCLISQSPVKGSDEFLMVIKDISEVVNLQKRLIQSEKLSALGQMISGVAHELNNPLAGILGYSQLLLQEELSEQVRSDIEVIGKEAKRCQKIVKNLLTFARKNKSERQVIDINEVINSILELKSYQLKVDSIEVVKELDTFLPKVIGDYHQLQQVFLNLINNAHDALRFVEKPNKQIVVATEQFEDFLRIKIIDNGMGISDEDKIRIFDPFYTTKEVGQGTGLGLSICYGIVQSHQGNFYVESELGKGATLVVELPLTGAEAIESAYTKSTLAVGKEVELSVEPKRILVIDDEPVIVDLCKRILTKEGHNVQVSSNGEEALQIIVNDRFDILICDIKMPQMNGEKFYHELKEKAPHLAKKLIFTTGDVISNKTKRFLESSKHFYLPKPFKTRDLLDAIKNV
jgi:two-component system NtrC family sensor kinase